MEMLKFVYFVLASFCGGVFASNILLVDNVTSRSHRIWNYAIVRALLDRGHNLTVLGLKPINRIVHENFTLYELEDPFHGLNNDKNKHSLGVLKTIYHDCDYETIPCSIHLESPSFQAILNYPSDFFDLLIFDVTFNCLLPLIETFNYPPSIGVTAYLISNRVLKIFGNTINPSYEPIMYSKLTSKMDFYQRLQNFIFTLAETYTAHYKYLPEWNRMTRKAFGRHAAQLGELQSHLSLVLTNTVAGFHYSRLLPPNVKQIGGIHIEGGKELPQDLQEIMDNSKHGVIIFSLGSNFRSEDIDPAKIRDILDAFSRMNQTIIWKFGSELKNIPNNVILRKWFPQSDLLAHNKTKLFISHCGALSTLEAAHFGVPVLSIPIIVDQIHNAGQIEAQKWGKTLNFAEITAETMFDTVQKIIDNSEYYNNVQRISKIVRDRTLSAKERATFWIEYAIRHNGTHFLDAQTRHLPFYIQSSLDIYLFLFTLTTVLIMLITLFINSFILFINNYINRKMKTK